MDPLRLRVASFPGPRLPGNEATCRLWDTRARTMQSVLEVHAEF